MGMNGKIFIAKAVAVPLLLGSVALGGCGTPGTPPTRELANTEMTIKQAREAEAITYAPLELRFAEDNFRAAKAAVENEEYEKARELAEKALADATLAEAKSNSAKAKKFSIELQDSIKALQTEVDRMQPNEN